MTLANRVGLTADRAVPAGWLNRRRDFGRDLVPILERRASAGRNVPVLLTWRYLEKAVAHQLRSEAAPDAGRVPAKMPVVGDGLLRRMVGAPAIHRGPMEVE